MVRKFLIALSFLTVLPFKGVIREKEIQSSVIFFPFIGAFEGILLCLLSIFLIRFFPSSVVSILLLIFLFLFRGIFHIDGLSDTADALFYKETGDRKKDVNRRIEIMKDSTVGVGGSVATVMDIFFKFVLIKEIIEIHKFILFVFIFCLSRWMIIPMMYYGKPATQTGLGALFVGKIEKIHFILSSLLPVFLVFYFVIQKKIIFLLIFILCYCLSMILKKFFERKFSGITGDHLGATVEISEGILLLIFFLFYEKVWLNI